MILAVQEETVHWTWFVRDFTGPSWRQKKRITWVVVVGASDGNPRNLQNHPRIQS